MSTEKSSDIQPTESDRAAAREIEKAQQVYDPPCYPLDPAKIAIIIAKHHAEERERIVRMEELLRAGILAMTGRARIAWANRVRDFIL